MKKGFPMMIRNGWNLNKGLGFVRVVHVWTLERMIAADYAPGDMRWTLMVLALRALRGISPFKARICESEGRTTGLPDGRCGNWSLAC